MAGFAAIFNPTLNFKERQEDFNTLVQTTARCKRLDLPGVRTSGRFCLAEKLDAACSLHKGVVEDPVTGSWLMAAGTVIALQGDNHPGVLLNTLLKEYLDHGIRALEVIDGFFAMVIYDSRQKTLAVIGDPTGQYSIFYGERDGKTFISTSVFAVVEQVGADLDALNVESFLRSGRGHGNGTFWKNVKRIPHGTLLRISAEKNELVDYWAPVYDEDVAGSKFNDAIEQGASLIERMFDLCLRREGKVWADLTGGNDTRLTTLFMDKLGLPFTAYCVGPENHPDVVVSAGVARAMSWEYQHMPFPYDWAQSQFDWYDAALEKGDARLCVPAAAGVLWGHTQRSRSMGVNVTGLGADEWREATYLSTYLLDWGKRYHFDPLIDAAILTPIPAGILKRDGLKEVRAEWHEYLEKEDRNFTHLPKPIQGNLLFVRYRYPAHGGAYLSANAGTIRSISPFSCKPLVNFCMSLNYQWRINYLSRYVRALFESQNPRLAGMQLAGGGIAAPIRWNNLAKFWPLLKPVINRNLQRVTRKVLGKPLSLWTEEKYSHYPLPAWRTALYQRVEQEGWLEPDRMTSGHLYQPQVLQKLVADAHQHPLRHSDFLDRVLTIELALRRASGKG